MVDPLVPESGRVAASGGAAGSLAVEYVEWSRWDAEIGRVVRQSTVSREHRELDRTVNEFEPGDAPGGWTKLIRYDFRVVWEEVAALGAVAGLLGGLLSLLIARVTMYVRRKPPGFPVGG